MQSPWQLALQPAHCPSCGNAALPEFSQPAGVALCPRCGTLLRRSRGALVPVGLSTESVSNFVVTRMRGDDKTRERIINDLGADSLDVVELMMALEEEFGVNIDVN